MVETSGTRVSKNQTDSYSLETPEAQFEVSSVKGDGSNEEKDAKSILEDESKATLRALLQRLENLTTEDV
jgi:hypothetical protein